MPNESRYIWYDDYYVLDRERWQLAGWNIEKDEDGGIIFTPIDTLDVLRMAQG